MINSTWNSSNVEANPLRKMPSGQNERATEKTSKTACVHADDAHERSSTPDDYETERSSEWIRNLETFSGRMGHRGRYRAKLMQLLQFPFVGDRGRALAEWERLVRQHEAQSSDTLQHTIKAAILCTQPTRSMNGGGTLDCATRLQVYDAPRSEWTAMHQAYREWCIARRERHHTNGS